METENTPKTIQFITLDDLFDGFNGNGRWLQGHVKQFIEDEDADLVDGAPSWVSDYVNDDNFEVVIRGKQSGYGTRIRIDFSAYGFRRGVLLMGNMLPNFPEQEYGLSNWYLGFTVAGNGTPAYIFPVKDDISRAFASEVLLKAIL